ncbi:hypothetical protein CCP3SC15_770002 [Gammaproteobacteria bacterium]
MENEAIARNGRTAWRQGNHTGYNGHLFDGCAYLTTIVNFYRAGVRLTPVFRSASRVGIWFVSAFLWFFCSTNYVHAEPPNYLKPFIVAVVQSENSESYLEFTKALRDNILKLDIDLVVVDDPTKPLPNSDLVISVGMKAATAVAASNAITVLNVLIPKAGYKKLLRDFSARANSKTFSAIFLDQPLARQLYLIAAVLPNKRQVGVLFDSFPKDEQAQLRQQISLQRLSLHERVISATLPLHEALQEVLQESDVLLALPDSTVYNSSTLRNILLATYRRGIPLIGFSPAYVNAGALCAIFSTPAQIAAQAVLSVRQFREMSTLPTAQYPQWFEVMVNEQVGRSLGLSIKNAAELRNEMSALIRETP